MSNHTMIKRTEDDGEVWYCPDCHRTLLVHSYKPLIREVLEPGDADAVHAVMTMDAPLVDPGELPDDSPPPEWLKLEDE